MYGDGGAEEKAERDAQRKEAKKQKLSKITSAEKKRKAKAESVAKAMGGGDEESAEKTPGGSSHADADDDDDDTSSLSSLESFNEDDSDSNSDDEDDDSTAGTFSRTSVLRSTGLVSRLSRDDLLTLYVDVARASDAVAWAFIDAIHSVPASYTATAILEGGQTTAARVEVSSSLLSLNGHYLTMGASSGPASGSNIATRPGGSLGTGFGIRGSTNAGSPAPAPHAIRIAIAAHCNVARVAACNGSFAVGHAAISACDALLYACAYPAGSVKPVFFAPSSSSQGGTMVIQGSLADTFGDRHTNTAGVGGASTMPTGPAAGKGTNANTASNIGRSTSLFSRAAPVNSNAGASTSSSAAAVASAVGTTIAIDPYLKADVLFTSALLHEHAYLATTGSGSGSGEQLLEEAQRRYSAALSLCPHHAPSLARLANLSLIQCKGMSAGVATSARLEVLARGLSLARRALRADPRDHYAYATLGRLLRHQARVLGQSTADDATQATLKALTLLKEGVPLLSPSLLPWRIRLW
jgi:hypothetical protein